MLLYTVFFIAVNAVHVSGGFFRPSSGAQTVHTASGICQACLLPTASMGELAVTAIRNIV
jgi:hypothetical protein